MLTGSKEIHALWYLSNYFQSVPIKLLKQSFNFFDQLSAEKDSASV